MSRKRVLAGGLVAGEGRGGEGGVDAVEELLARGAAEVEGARFHEVLEHAFVERLGVHAGRMKSAKSA
jgi:hypothetical protein